MFFLSSCIWLSVLQACILIVAALTLVNTSTAHTVNRALLQQGELARHLVDQASSMYVKSLWRELNLPVTQLHIPAQILELFNEITWNGFSASKVT
jgi:hypothetical protein